MRTDAPLVTMCCMASCERDDVLYGYLYYRCDVSGQLLYLCIPFITTGSNDWKLKMMTSFHRQHFTIYEEETSSLFITYIAIAEGMS